MPHFEHTTPAPWLELTSVHISTRLQCTRDMSERLKFAFIEQQPDRYIARWLQSVHWQVQRVRCEVDSV